MQQRRPRLGDILDDYCPRERRVTNHAVVAMIDDQVKQTRCTTCEAEHEYKEARVPASRRRKDTGVLADAASALAQPVLATDDAQDDDISSDPSTIVSDEPIEDAVAVADAAAADDEPPAVVEDDGPVHRRLIRATLPRPEGQQPEWKEPEFTIRQPGRGGREVDGNRNGHGGHGQGHGGHGQRPGGRHRRPMRAGGGQGNAANSRFGGPRGQGGQQGPGGQGGHGHGGQRQHGGNRPGGGGGNRGPGRKRGR